MQEDSIAKDLLRLIQSRHLSQESIAKAAKVSQATVSRALRGRIERQGRARTKLFNYIQQELQKEDLSGTGKEKVVKAFESIWDSSEEHATAIAKIIRASGGLLPVGRLGGNR
jgi:transcriptional regulator with XRE-family HTH domain